MNPSLRRNTCDDAVNKEPIDSTVAGKSKSEPKTPVISHNYEAAISQPDIPMHSKVDNNTQNTNWLEPSDKLSVPTGKRNLYARGKTGVTTKKVGVVFKSKIQAKKITETLPSIGDDAEIEKESVPIPAIILNVENYRKENSDGIVTHRQTPPNLYQFQKDLIHSRDAQKTSEIAKNGKNLTIGAVGAFQENCDEIDKDTRSCSLQNKFSKIPRIKPPIKPNSFLPIHEESRIYPSAKLSKRNEVKCSTNIKLSADNEEKKLIESSRRETLNAMDYQKLKSKDILSTVHGNSNLWCFEKNSEMDADEEFEGDLLIPTKESPIIGADDDPRSATLLKSLALKCECPSCNNYKYASTARTNQHSETESWSSPEMGNARKWKSMRHRKFIDESSEDLDSLSDYNVINCNNDKPNRKNNRSNLTGHITKQSSTVNHARMKPYRTTNFLFFNVFFDIIFWPFIFLRAKQ